MQAFQISSQLMACEFVDGSRLQVPGKHQQVVVSALRNLGPVLASEGYFSSCRPYNSPKFTRVFTSREPVWAMMHQHQCFFCQLDATTCVWGLHVLTHASRPCVLLKLLTPPWGCTSAELSRSLCRDRAGVEKVMKHALQLLNVAPDGTARVAVLQDYVKHCLPENSEKRVPALTRVKTYSDAIAANTGAAHAALLKWGMGADEV